MERLLPLCAPGPSAHLRASPRDHTTACAEVGTKKTPPQLYIWLRGRYYINMNINETYTIYTADMFVKVYAD